MTKLQDLYGTHGQSPWLDNLKRGWLTSGELKRWVDRGVRGVTSNPTIFANAISGTAEITNRLSAGLDRSDPALRRIKDEVGP